MLNKFYSIDETDNDELKFKIVTKQLTARIILTHSLSQH